MPYIVTNKTKQSQMAIVPKADGSGEDMMMFMSKQSKILEDDMVVHISKQARIFDVLPYNKTKAVAPSRKTAFFAHVPLAAKKLDESDDKKPKSGKKSSK